MKFSATFAVLAVFVANAVVSATSYRPSADALEARAEFVESALDDVWERFYDELLEEVEAREYDEDIFEARDFDDEELYVRSPQVKKFASDLAIGLGQKAPGMVKQYSQAQSFQHRQSRPTFTQAMAAKKGTGSTKKRSFDDEELFERQVKKFASDLAIGLGQKAPGMIKQYSQAQSFQHRQSRPTFTQAMAAKKAAGSKKRSFDDEELVERQVKKFASDLAIGLGQKAPGMVKQYSQGVAFQNRQKLPTFQQSMAAKKTGNKKRSFDDDELVQRQVKKFAGDLAIGLAQKAPGMIKQYSQAQSFQHRQSRPTFTQVMAAKKAAGNKKRSFDDEELVERQVKKFAGDLALGLAQKAPGMVKQYSQGVAFQNRQKLPTFQQSMAAKKSSSKK